MSDYLKTVDVASCKRHLNETLSDECLFCCIEELQAKLEKARGLIDDWRNATRTEYTAFDCPIQRKIPEKVECADELEQVIGKKG